MIIMKTRKGRQEENRQEEDTPSPPILDTSQSGNSTNSRSWVIYIRKDEAFHVVIYKH